ncbi:UvrD-helicase domain-containing protein [Nocardia sp. XZ_19_369]|uniref:UvrD-helicase domain-containing protein n=1 Tax=Nocardia sp. XZ_19_369 TaxID=2769487 RepID=UPI00188E22C4|nr:UvrD-helicase domain-containing protein [Nocardia sp. XZ_19_369]
MTGDTVGDLAAAWGIRDCTVAADRFLQPDWLYEETLATTCPQGHSTLHAVRKPYENNGKTLRYTALICPECKHAYEMRDLGYKTYAELRKASEGQSCSPPIPATDRPRRNAASTAARTQLTPTAEQQAIIDAARAQQNLIVQAGAGAGKTSTLEMVGHALTGKKVAYIAYNRTTKDDAKKRFPDHVHCYTAHGLARSFIQRYRHRIENAQRQRADEQARILNIRRTIELTSTVLMPRDTARIAMEMVTRYCHSDDAEIGQHHIPHQVGIDDDELAWLADAILPYAHLAWADIRNIDGRLKFDHDHYFKMWALTEPPLRYDVIMLDEAQDTNPALAKVIAAQDAQQILVGDSNQQLYSWRGAIDALDNWNADVRLQLRQSWRFGQAIAEEANQWLSVIGTELRLVGNPTRNSTVGRVRQPKAVLCRTNAEAIKQVMRILETGQQPALVGDGRTIKTLAEAALQLKGGNRPSHRELFAFRTWGELQDYVENDSGGRDLKPFVDLIDEHGVEAILQTVDRLVPDDPAAEVVVSTAHKSKGREWDTVAIAEDYREPAPDDDGSPGQIPPADAMLAYVAVTRAKQRLDREGLAWIDNYLTRRTAPQRRGPTTATAPIRSSVPAASLCGPEATVHEALPSAQELAEHLHQHAGTIIDRIESRDISGNTIGYTILVCSHAAYPIVTVATTGLRFSTPRPDTEIAITAYSDQVDLARALLDVTAMTSLANSYTLDTGHRMFSPEPLVVGTDIHGIVADHHPYFGTEFGVVHGQSGHELMRLVTLLPLVGDEVQYVRSFGPQTLSALWRNNKTRLPDLKRRSAT